jgi:hypothetical protein
MTKKVTNGRFRLAVAETQRCWRNCRIYPSLCDKITQCRVPVENADYDFADEALRMAQKRHSEQWETEVKKKLIIIWLSLCLLGAIFVPVILIQEHGLSTQDLGIKLQWSYELITDLKEDTRVAQEDIAQLSLLWLWASSYWMKDDLANTDRLLRQIGDYYFDVIEPQLYQDGANITWEKGLPANSTVVIQR